MNLHAITLTEQENTETRHVSISPYEGNSNCVYMFQPGDKTFEPPLLTKLSFVVNDKELDDIKMAIQNIEINRIK